MKPGIFNNFSCLCPWRTLCSMPRKSYLPTDAALVRNSVVTKLYNFTSFFVLAQRNSFLYKLKTSWRRPDLRTGGPHILRTASERIELNLLILFGYCRNVLLKLRNGYYVINYFKTALCRYKLYNYMYSEEIEKSK